MSKRWLGLLLLVVWLGGSGTAHAAVTVTALPTSISIGSVNVGASGMGTTLLSASGGTANIASFDLTAAGCGEFRVTTAPPLTISSGGSQTVTVQLAPTSPGAKSCSIVAKDSGGVALVTFSATGTGVAPAISVSPPSFDFGGVRVANAQVTTQFTISNTGNATLTISAITFSGAASADYSLNPPVTSSLQIPAGMSQPVTVVFNPSAAGTRMASMDIASDDPVTATKSVPLTGTGTNAKIAVTDVNFNVVNDGATSTQNITISNSAATPLGALTVTSATITGGGGFFFFGAIQSCSGNVTCNFSPSLTVSTGTITVPVRCQPPAAASGTQTATVTFSSDSDSGGDSTAQLTCTAGRPNIVVSTNTLSFGNVPVNTTSAAQTVTITNNGNTQLTYSLTEVPSLTQYPIAATCTSNCTVNPGASAMFSVTFRPTAIGTLMTRIDITSNDPDPGEGTFSINVSGTGTAPQISLAPTGPLTFANTEVGQTSATQMVVATNIGNVPLTISSATFSSGGADYTATAVTVPQTLVPNASVTWNIACKPSAPGSRPGNFRIASNSLTGATTDVSLSCTSEQGIVATNPTSLNFGGVTQASTRSLPFTLQNTGNVAISGITAVLDKTTVGYQFDPTTVPTTLAAGASVTLTVTFAPQSGNDGGPAMITFTGSWGTHGATTTAVLTLDGDGQEAGYDITPGATFDFGSFRFDTTSQITYHIVNTGQANVAILTQLFTPDAGTMASEITVVIRKAGTVVALPQTLSAGQQLDVTVTARPNNRTGLIGGHIDIHSDFTMSPDRRVTLTGNATTAALSIPAIVDFGRVDVDGPAQMQTIMVTNSGAATLDVSSITKMAGGSTAFTVTLPTALTRVAPGDNLPLTITYKPTVERPPNQFDTLVLVANLAGIFGGPAQAMITVQGRGIDRHIAVDAVAGFPLAILGNTAPTQAITVHNNGEATLSVTALMFGGDPVWQLVDPSPAEVAGNGSHDFMVRFAPTAPGTFSGQLILMNNDNGQPMAMVTLTGSAAYVDVGGGGDCNAGGRGAGGGISLVLGALVLGTLRRRRNQRRRAGRSSGVAIALVVLGSVTIGAPVARADSIGITVFEPTPATTGASFQLQSPDVGEDGSWAATTILSHASDPLVLIINTGTTLVRGTAIRRSTLLQVGGAYAFLGRFEAGANLPLYMQSGDSDPAMVSLLGKPVKGTATGDLALHAKARLWRGSGAFGSLLAGASVTVLVPTATKDQFTGSDKPEARLLLLGSVTPAVLRSRFTISANAGAILRSKAVYGNFARQSGVAWSGGASYRILDKLWATAEMFGEVTPSGQQRLVIGGAPQTVTLWQIEWLAGLGYQVGPRFTIGVAGGRGMFGAPGAPDLRGVFSLAISSERVNAPLHPPEPRKPDVDADGDGIPDSRDKCPSQPEDRNGVEDADGCPELDSDHDGIPDSRDRCPEQPETVNGVEDADGCPDTAGTNARPEANRDPSAVKAAEEAFARGRELLKQKQFSAACAAFEQSQHLDPAAGTRYNLAGCYVEIGKLASALALYRDLALVDKNTERRAKSDDLAGQLAQRVPRLKLIVKGAPAGLNVTMNGTSVTAQIGVETPVDLGTYTITADAPRYRGWRKTVEVKQEGEVLTVEIDLGAPSAP